jgi:hypothetical protein
LLYNILWKYFHISTFGNFKTKINDSDDILYLGIF